MLQAPAHLSRVSGHNHFKKSWLMQTQNESQANVGCEKVYSLACSSSRPISCAPITGADAKQNSQLSAGNSSARGYIAIGSSVSCPIRPLVVGGSSIGATNIEGCGASAKELGKHVSLLACVESEPRSLTLASNDSKGDSLEEEENDCLSAKRPACGSTSFPTTFHCFGASSEDLLKKQSSEPHGNIFDESHSRDYSQRFQRLSLGNRVEILQRANASSELHLSVPDTCIEGEASSEHGVGTCQKDLASGHDCSSSSPKQDCSGREHPDLCVDVIASEDMLNSPLDDTAEDQHVIFEKSGESYGGWMPFGSKGSSGNSNVETKSSRGDEMQEVGKAHEVNAIYNDGGIGRSILRSCSHCGTTKTPLWRSGPQGPKSLCNACGIRFKKLRRSSGQNDSSDLPSSPPVTPNASRAHIRSLKRKQDNAAKSPVSLSQEDRTKTAFKGEAPQIYKKSRWPSLFLKDDVGQGEHGNDSSCESYLSWSLQSTSLASPSQKKVFYEKYFSLQDESDSKISTLEKDSVLSRVFADEEEEAAVLLMALSCGLVNA